GCLNLLWRGLIPRYQANQGQQLNGLPRLILKGPLTVLEGRVLENEAIATVKNTAIAKNAVHKPAVFKQKRLCFELSILVFRHWHKAALYGWQPGVTLVK